MKKHVFESLTDFYADSTNKTRSLIYKTHERLDRKSFVGLSYAETQQYKFSYPLGVEELSRFSSIEIQKSEKVRYYNQFDGHDIDIERLYESMDFLIDHRYIKKQPKAIDIFVNVAENCEVDYSQMLSKTYAATKTIDYLESLGVRCALYAVICFIPKFKYGKKARYGTEPIIIEVCIKNHHDSLNLGTICTAISPWMLRQHVFLWLAGNIAGIHENFGYATRIPQSEIPQNSIVIDTADCLSVNKANQFIQNLKVA